MLTRRRLLLIALSLPAILAAQQDSTAAAKTFTVAGKVNHPGKFRLREGMRVMDGINMAGGFADFAHKKKVTITRGNRQFGFNYADFIHGKSVEQNILLREGDEIVVP